jgi:EAL domain-containing protein (putative c-di-GMP-specific phosphodiesterase class I)
MSIAEETGLIVPIGHVVLRTAAAALSRRQTLTGTARRLYVSVNLGLQQVCAPTLVSDIRAALQDTGIDPGRLVLEITEDVLLARAGVLERLRARRASGGR